MNRGEIIERAQTRVGVSERPDDTILHSLYMDGYRDVLVKTGCRVRSQTVTTADLTGQADGDYLLPSGMLSVVGIDGDDGTLREVADDDIRDARRETSTALSTYYAVLGYDLLMFYPDPADDAEFTLYYVPDPTDATADTDTPSLVPSVWHRLIEDYMAWRLADMDDDSTSQMGERYREHYLSGIADMKRAQRNMGGRRNPRARVGRRRYAHANDVDVR